MIVSYIEEVSAQVSLVDTSILETNTNTVYIPGPHYIQTGDSTVTPLGQMQVITGDYSEVSRLTYDAKMSDNIYSGADCPVQLQHRSSEPDQDDGDDGYLIDFLDHSDSKITAFKVHISTDLSELPHPPAIVSSSLAIPASPLASAPEV